MTDPGEGGREDRAMTRRARRRVPSRGGHVFYQLGAAMAVAISWSTHGSIPWAALHGLLSWLYVLYYAFTRSTPG